VADRVTFTRSSADRIAKVVRRVEAGNRDTSWTPSPPRGGESVVVFRVCKFTGSWSLNSSKTITFLNQTNTPNTVVAQNIFVTISGTTVTSTFRNCAIAKDGTAWYLISAEC
jgi:hypothetical protein